ncbi:MAG: GAP family protein [Thermoleophilaceae bacterium]|nr:GAP family protein [Thermoleophilaceae bacterium]
MLKLLLFVIPLGLAGAVSPVLLTEQTVVLSGPDGRRTARAFAVGAMLTLLLFVAALVFFGGSIKLPKTPHLDATLDVVIGALLMALALYLHLRSPAGKPDKPARGAMNPRAACLFGTVSMATNFTTLALMIPASKEIAASGVDFAGQVAAAVVLVVLASTPVWLPLVLTALAPGPALRGLDAFGAFIQRSGRLATVILLALVGTLLVVRGAVRLLT